MPGSQDGHRLLKLGSLFPKAVSFWALRVRGRPARWTAQQKVAVRYYEHGQKAKKGPPAAETAGVAGGIGPNARGGYRRRPARSFQPSENNNGENRNVETARQRRARAGRTRRRRPGTASQRLRLPPRSRQQLHARNDRSVRARQHDRKVRAARGRADPRHGAGRPSPARTAAPRNHRRRRHAARRLQERQNFRRTDAHQSRILAEAGGRPRAADDPGDGPA